MHPAAVVRQGGAAETVLLHAQEGGRRRCQVHEVCVYLHHRTYARLFFLLLLLLLPSIAFNSLAIRVPQEQARWFIETGEALFQ